MDRSIINKIVLVAVLAFAFVLAPVYYQVVDGNVGSDHFIGTAWALIPAVVAIVLALVTKEVYSSLFLGILVGALYLAGFNLPVAFDLLVNTSGEGVGFIESPDIGIVMFLVLLGAMVALMSRSGASSAFAEWASKHVKSRVGAQIATTVLGILIFVDDYFNCLTVGSVMRPLTDRYKVSRAKLAYLIDSTAAPICIIAPISSWAAAVSGCLDGTVYDGQGFEIFCNAIFYNYYAILTIIMVFMVILLNMNFGPMKRFEEDAEKGILHSHVSEGHEEIEVVSNPRGCIFDLVLPIVSLIVACILCLLYTGGFFDGVGLIEAFGDCSASVGLAMGSLAALVFSMLYYCVRKVLTLDDCMKAVPAGFKAMVPAILILVFAWTLKGMTSALHVDVFVNDLIGNSGELMKFLPAAFFLLGAFIAFCTGTSWGTFGVLIPVVAGVFSTNYDLMLISTSACMAGAVWGDHISPVSDTTIMSSAGAQCNLIDHVATQLPYTLLVGMVSCVSFVFAGFIENKFVCLAMSVALLFVSVYVMKRIDSTKCPEDGETADR
ncbi:MAG: Na+/H+ antiporter NhaC family protein [archaeon]|nr:Na+/H+ antiporter NhaC family protein [archaeon]